MKRTEPKPKKCKVCRELFVPTLNTMQKVCGIDCAKTLAISERVKAEKRQAVKERKALRERKEKLKTRSDWMKEAQREFNAYIRARDRAASYTCICCGSLLDWGTRGVRGHAVDAGHYRSIGSAPHLRFDERNCHAQRVVCNRHGAGRAVDYRIGLVRRIGLAAVESLEADQTPRHYSVEDLQEIKRTSAAKRRELEKA
jgi:hypothetical protein